MKPRRLGSETFLTEGDALFLGPTDAVLLARKDPAYEGRRSGGRLAFALAKQKNTRVLSPTAILAGSDSSTQEKVRAALNELRDNRKNSSSQMALRIFSGVDISRMAGEQDDALLDAGDTYYIRAPGYNVLMTSRWLDSSRDTMVPASCIGVNFVETPRVPRCSLVAVRRRLMLLCGSTTENSPEHQWASPIMNELRVNIEEPGAARILLETIHRNELPRRLNLVDAMQTMFGF